MDIRIEHRNVFCKAVTVQRVKGDYIAIGEKATFSNGVIGPDKNQTVLGGWNKKPERKLKTQKIDTSRDFRRFSHPISTLVTKSPKKLQAIWEVATKKHRESSTKSVIGHNNFRVRVSSSMLLWLVLLVDWQADKPDVFCPIFKGNKPLVESEDMPDISLLLDFFLDVAIVLTWKSLKKYMFFFFKRKIH